VVVQVKGKSGMKKWRFPTNVSLYSKMVKDTAIVTVEDE